nr:hypothetical protein [Tanacetum cinerariifolium]
MVWAEENVALYCSSSSPFSTRIKRKGGRKSVQTSHKGKEIMYEFPRPTKESQLSVTNYKRSIVNGKAKMVEVEDVGLVQPVISATKVQRSTAKNPPPLKPRRKGIEFSYKNLFGDFLHCDGAADELVLVDNWQYEGLAIDDVRGSSKHCDLVHENVVYNGHSLLNMDKERFSNNVVLDDVVTDTLAYTLPLSCNRRHGRGLRRLIGLNVDAVDDDPRVMKQVSLPARSSNSEYIPVAGDTYLSYNLSCFVAHTSRTADRHHYLPPVVNHSSSCFLD